MLEAQITHKTLPSGEALLGAISLRVMPGEVVALLGASGTGKTSLFRILLGLDAAFSGHVHRRATRLGAQFQEPRLLPWLSVAENLRLVRPDADVHASLDEVGLDDIGSLYPRQISLGMARRVALARALLVQPDLLVLDEPFASLDPAISQRVANRIIQQARAHQAGVVIAMHDLGLAAQIADRLIVLTGRPAQIAADIAIRPGVDAATRLLICGDLAQRFAFLLGATSLRV